MSLVDCETTYLESKADTWRSRDMRIVGGAMIGIGGLIIGTYYYSALLPAFEEDLRLAWAASDTTNVVTLAELATTMGLLISGPFADKIAPWLLLAFEALTVCIGMVCVTLARSPPVVITIISSVSFAKGLMWPSINALVASNLSPAKHDLTFVLAAMASRLGELCTAASFGILLQRFLFGWREATLIVLLCVMTFFVSAGGAMPRDLSEPQATDSQSEQPPNGDARSPMVGRASAMFEQRWYVEDIGGKWKRLASSLDGWLNFVILVGTYSVWAVADYGTVIVRDLFGLSPGLAALTIARLPLGCFAGLTVALMATSLLGVNGGRVVHVLQSLSCVVALLMLSMPDLSLSMAKYLIPIVGFGFVVNTYIPYQIYAASAPPQERAFRSASLDGISCLVGVGFHYMYGKMRESGGTRGERMSFCVAAFMAFLGTIAMVAFYWRLKNREQQTQQPK